MQGQPAATNQIQIVSLFPPPPPYFRLYKPGAEFPLKPPPPPAPKENYYMFGRLYSVFDQNLSFLLERISVTIIGRAREKEIVFR
jgi:hypothetical protein